MAGGVWRPASRGRVVVALAALTCWCCSDVSPAFAQSAAAPGDTAAPAEPAAPGAEPAAPGAEPAENGAPAETAASAEAEPPQPSEPSDPSETKPAPQPDAAAVVAPAVASTDPASAAACTQGSDGPLNEIAYVLERLEVRGNRRTSASAIGTFVPIGIGEALDVDNPAIEGIRYRLLGTGWFDSVETRLERGSGAGRVVLVVDVVERNTLVIQKLAAGVGWSVENVRTAEGGGSTRQAQPYLGMAVADTNFLGLGKELGTEFLISPDQQGVALKFNDPLLRVPRWSLHTRLLFTKGQEYFGGDDVLASVSCDPELLDEEDLVDCQSAPPAAVVGYWRAGWALGGTRDLGVFTHLSLGYRGDFVRVPPGHMPVAASTERGRGGYPRAREPIDFSIEQGNSIVSMANVGLTYDKRDSTATPTVGTLVTFAGDLASTLLGSDYDFVRLQTSFHRWRPLPWGHVIRGGVYAGTVFGNAPFFYKFFVSDLTDLAPSRILGLNLDHRPAPNIFGLMQSGSAFDNSSGTAISQMRIEELAARLDVEYVWPFTREGEGFLKSGDFFVLLGMYMLADPRDLRVAVPGYEGIARAPIDLTFDVGLRLDTSAGVFRFGFAKLAWLPVTGSTVQGGP